jgi:major membrane immunogen (membrane-anchored lipoprotein)
VSRFEICDGRIVRSVVVSSSERRGRQIESEGYMRQFSDLSLSDSGGLSGRVDGITGATVSSRAFESAALLALKLDVIVKE